MAQMNSRNSGGQTLGVRVHWGDRAQVNESSSNSVTLEEKDLRRTEKFNGDPTESKGWMLDFQVAIGQVDRGL
eukprot:12367483-Karenia_brevis.AAC.1